MTEKPAGTTRRNFLVFGAGALVVAAVPLAARRRSPGVHQRTMPVMGTIAELTVVHEHAAHAQAALDAAFAELTRVDELMTRYSRTSDVGRVNLAAPDVPVRVSSETATVVLAALNWAAASGGTFDPAIEHVIELWDVQERTTPPQATAVRRLAGRELYRALELSVHGGEPVIVRRDADVGIDLGGIAKGYAVDRAGDVLRAHGIRKAIVNVGGDLVAIGEAPEGGPWRAGVRSPTNPSALIAEVDVTDAAVATSGDYERFFEYHGVRYHHLMDPSTAAPRRTPMHSITVRATSCLHADAAATACYGMDAARARGVLASAHAAAEVVRTA
mgnify:CR=1 FL=1